MWPNLRKKYDDENVLKADEAELFLKLSKDETIKFKGGKACSR